MAVSGRGPADALSAKQQSVLLLKQMQAKLEAAERASNEPIAVIGLGCRFPGGGTDAPGYWRMLRDGVDAITEVPRQRFSVDAYFDSDPASSGSMATRWGGFVDGVEMFDAAFFGISPREALSMDPQQRLILEVAWEALEDAAQPPDLLESSATAVVLGICTNDYTQMVRAAADRSALEQYSGTGGALSVAAGRLSYFLGLHGPSLVVDTACSSSLVAVHLAMKSLRTGESRLALAGGVNLTLSPYGFIQLSRLRTMAADGRCKTFDAAADGFARGEGCGIVILKRLSDALHDGDRILAVIKGSAVNHDGRSSGLTAPNGLAQTAVIREALANAGVTPGEVGYVEAHGTGTALGDPIEVQALGDVFRAGRPSDRPLIVGSVKTNIGHLEGAAGIASLIKVILGLGHREVPPHLHFKNWNPHIARDGFALSIPTARMAWPAIDGRRIAGVSAFGFSGTNAHLLLEEPPESPRPAAAARASDRPLHILCLSARSEAALPELAERYAHRLADQSLSLADCCHTANAGRSHFTHRLAVVAASGDEAREKLTRFAAGDPAAAVACRSSEASALRVAFLFTGQGSQYVGMGRGLYQTNARFRAIMDEADALLRSELPRPLLSVLFDSPDAPGLIDETRYAQPALFALEYALCDLWRSWGIEPVALLGHSVGEYVAACVAGVFDFEHGLRLVAARGRLMQALPPGGAMAAVFTGEHAVRSASAPWPSISVAAINGRSNTVISGPDHDVAQALAQLEAAGIRTRRLRVSHAFHSSLCDPMLADLDRVAAETPHAAPRIPVVSNLTGQVERNFGAAYWRQHARQPVRFAEGLEALRRLSCTAFVEIGPEPVLCALGGASQAGEETWVSSLTREASDTDGAVGEWRTLLTGLGQIYTRGAGVDWNGFDRGIARRKVALPTYPWQRQRFWIPSASDRLPEARSPVIHPLLGRRIETAGKEHLFEASLAVDAPDFLAEHRIHGALVFPAAAFLEMALAAAQAAFGTPLALRDVVFREPLVLGEQHTTTVQTVITPGEPAGFAIWSRAGRSFVEHVAGSLVARSTLDADSESARLDEVRARVRDPVSASAIYDFFRECGLEHGPRFRAIEDVWRAPGEALARIRQPEDRDTHLLHPVTLDACLQVLGATAFGEDSGEGRLPAAVDSLQLHADPIGDLWAHAVVRADARQSTGEITVYDDRGAIVATMRGIRLRAGGRPARVEGGQDPWRNWLYRVEWTARPILRTTPARPAIGTFLIFADASGIAAALADLLRADGARAVTVHAADGFARTGPDSYDCNPAARDDMRRLVEAEPCTGIVHLWSLLPAPASSVDDSVAMPQARDIGSVLHLVQSLTGVSQRLCLVTRGAWSETPTAAALWGLGRVVTLEQPDLECHCLDLETAMSAGEAAVAILAEIRSDDRENEIAYRGGERQTPRLVRLRADLPAGADAVRPDATYVITGGYGGLGLAVARHLVSRGARNIALVSRSGPSPATLAAVREIEQMGARIVDVRADVGDADELAAAIDRIRRSMPLVRGVIHAAGVLDDGVLPRLDWTRFDAVMRPKVAGALALDRLFPDLDFFVLFSSAASLMGVAGQANYAAANAVLDALAENRRARGLAAVSISWAGWSEVGMASGRVRHGRLGGRGIGAITPDHGLAALSWALGQHTPAHIAVLPIEWPAFLATFDGSRVPRLLADWVADTSLPRARSGGLHGVADALRVLPHALRGARLIAFVREQAAAVLGYPPDTGPAPRDGLFDVGLDSLMAVELRNRLQDGLGTALRLTPTIVFDHPTVEGLAEHISSHLPGSAAPTAIAPAAAPHAGSEPIAIVGLGCRFPGGGDGPEGFWRLLSTGTCAVGDFPTNRWDVDAFRDRMASCRGAFIEGVDLFDPRFFGISPREAVTMDPQQRLLLEVAWEALEHAGQAPSRLAGSATGVFVGMCNYDYQDLATKGDRIDGYAATGCAPSIAAGRVSYTLGLNGPAMVVDTACSSSLLAVHLAMQSLRAGECRMALAGGVNLIFGPGSTIAMTELHMMAADGRCKTFDAAADGFGRGEGCGLVVCKRLSDAEADGDRILAILRGSAVNQDGRSSGLTAPSGPAQVAVIRRALQAASIEPRLVSYVEVHGTGTPLGDPIEVSSLQEVFGDRPSDQPLTMGSVKTNLGHTEAAAGIAGLIKVVLSLCHRQIPAHLHLERLNPHISLDGFPVVIPTERRDWAPIDGRRVAGVSAWSFNGTNVHVVAEEAPPSVHRSSHDRPLQVLCVSARDDEALDQQVRVFSSYLAATEDDFAAVCHTAGAGRSHFARRLAVVAQTAEESRGLLEARRAATHGTPTDRGTLTPTIAFLFTGQGSQYAAMGRALYETEPVFRSVLDRCADVLRADLDRPLLDVMWSGGALLDETQYAQPALFALEVALAELWRSWGITPSAVLGHSVGEYAAACVAGALDLAEGLSYIAERGRIMAALPRGGAMAAATTDASTVRAAIACAGAVDVTIAAENGPLNTVISGPSSEVARVLALLHGDEIATRPLTVSHAFHSPLIDPVLDRLEAAATGLSCAAPRVPIVGNLTGEIQEHFDARYFRDHARDTVKFGAGMNTLAAMGCDLFLEIGPRPVLTSLGRACIAGGTWLPSLRGGGQGDTRDDVRSMLSSLASLYEHGADIDWAAFDRGSGTMVALPTYPFQRQRYWVEPSSRVGATPPGRMIHPLLGWRVRTAVRQSVFECTLGGGSPSYLGDHRVLVRAVLPAACLIEMMRAAAIERGSDGTVSLADLVLLAPMDVEEPRSVQTIVTPDEPPRLEILSAVPGSDDWTLHASASLVSDTPSAPGGDVADAIARCPDAVPVGDYYQAFAARGLTYGPAFRVIRDLWHGPRSAVARIGLPDELAGARPAPPVILDAIFQCLGAALTQGNGAGAAANDSYLPVAVDRLFVDPRAHAATWCVITLSNDSGDSIAGDATLYDDEGLALVRASGVRLARQGRKTLSARDLVHDIVWIERPDGLRRAPSDCVVLADNAGVGERLTARLQSRDGRCRMIQSGTPVAAADLDAACVIDLRALDATSAEAACAGVIDLLHMLARLPRSPQLLIVTRGARVVGAETAWPSLPQTALWGLGTVIALEHPELDSRRIDLDPDRDIDLAAGDLIEELAAVGGEVALRGGRAFVPQLRRRTESTERGRTLPPAPFALTLPSTGTLDGLAFAPCARRSPGPGEVEIEVRAAGLNFRDVMNALGIYPGDAGRLGLECAGLVSAVGSGVTAFTIGQEVIAVAAGSFASHVVATADLVVSKPEHLSFDEAATIPVALLTAWHSLVQLARLAPGQRVLVHAAAGGVGLAAIQVAQMVGAEIFATAGSESKRDYLRSLGIAHVMDSRSLQFAEEVMRITDGVDVVINSLSGDAIGKSLGVVRPGGVFLEIGKAGIWEAARVTALRPDIDYHVVALDGLIAAESASVGQLLRDVMAEIAKGTLKPLPVRAFPLEQAEQAFRLMQQAGHTGKIVISGAGLHPDASYLITGGLGSLGLAVARSMVDRGARHLTLVSRRRPGEDALPAIAALQAAGAEVQIAQCDVTSRHDMAGVLAALPGPLKGIVHAAGVLDDGVIANLDRARIASVMAPKVDGALVLHDLTATLPLDFFVLFASAAGVLGSAGQGNYAAANAFLDGLAWYRRRMGVPALSIDWGAWAESGMAARIGQPGKRGSRAAIAIDDALATFTRLLQDGTTQACVLPEAPDAVRQPAEASPRSFLATLAAAPESERRTLVSARVRALAAMALQMGDLPFDPRQALNELGLDSLMAVELRNALGHLIERTLPATLVFDYPSVEALADFVARELGLTPAGPARRTQDASEQLDHAISGMSGAEAAKELAEELDLGGY